MQAIMPKEQLEKDIEDKEEETQRQEDGEDVKERHMDGEDVKERQEDGEDLKEETQGQEDGEDVKEETQRQEDGEDMKEETQRQEDGEDAKEETQYQGDDENEEKETQPQGDEENEEEETLSEGDDEDEDEETQSEGDDEDEDEETQSQEDDEDEEEETQSEGDDEDEDEETQSQGDDEDEDEETQPEGDDDVYEKTVEWLWMEFLLLFPVFLVTAVETSCLLHLWLAHARLNSLFGLELDTAQKKIVLHSLYIYLIEVLSYFVITFLARQDLTQAFMGAFGWGVSVFSFAESTSQEAMDAMYYLLITRPSDYFSGTTTPFVFTKLFQHVRELTIKVLVQSLYLIFLGVVYEATREMEQAPGKRRSQECAKRALQKLANTAKENPGVVIRFGNIVRDRLKMRRN